MADTTMTYVTSLSNILSSSIQTHHLSNTHVFRSWVINRKCVTSWIILIVWSVRIISLGG